MRNVIKARYRALLTALVESTEVLVIKLGLVAPVGFHKKLALVKVDVPVKVAVAAKVRLFTAVVEIFPSIRRRDPPITKALASVACCPVLLIEKLFNKLVVPGVD